MPKQRSKERSTRKVRRAFQASSLDELDRAIIARLLSTPAVTDEQLASDFGVRRQTVNERRRSPALQQALAALQLPAMEILLRAQPSMARQLIQHSANSDPMVSIAAIRTAFGRNLEMLRQGQPSAPRVVRIEWVDPVPGGGSPPAIAGAMSEKVN